MTRHWTFGRKVGTGFAVIIVLASAIGGIAIHALRDVIHGKDEVINVDARLVIDAWQLAAASAEKSGASRGFLLTKEERFLNDLRDQRSGLLAIVGRLKQNVQTDERRFLVDTIERSEVEHNAEVDKVVAFRRTDAPLDSVIRQFDEEVVPKRKQLDAAVEAFVERENRTLAESNRAATERAARAETIMIGLSILLIAFATIVAFFLTRSLAEQVGRTVGQVQSSSAELQSTANQQATGSKQQATAMNEITTTISELLATSRQIAESAQRVAEIAAQTSSLARSGEGTVDHTHDSIGGIRRQMDLVVSRMLELGGKSQQIGAVLDIVSELAEQTNILAINATIEAAGAGESGRRFAVVADEIRKLADRVAGSTKEIRALIDDVRSSVNTTVMATETGSKAVDAGTKQFADVTSSFKQIAGMVATTMEAAREIELSTKQQSTAVEQVNIAIANVAQASRESEASSAQTLATASQLADLSKGLLRLVQPASE